MNDLRSVLARDDRRRPQDLLDLRALLAQLEPAEHERALIALALIQARGYARRTPRFSP